MTQSILFQSTHPRRVRPYVGPACAVRGYFNPRTREGCDLIGAGRKLEPVHFNPRTREGCDTPEIENRDKRIEFQSTHPRRVRLVGRRAVAVCHYFNPRTREGCDKSGRAGPRANDISIHAPAKGATRRDYGPTRANTHFNPRTREGCDLARRPNMTTALISIHAPAKGATSPLLT